MLVQMGLGFLGLCLLGYASGFVEYVADPDWKLKNRPEDGGCYDVAVHNPTGDIYTCSAKGKQADIFQADGTYIKSIGGGHLTQCHSIMFEYVNDNQQGDASIWITDHDDHTVKKFGMDGTLLATLGVSGKPSSSLDPLHFDEPTSVATNADRIYITDGEGGTNNRVVVLDRTTLKLIKAFGKKGKGQGQFDLPHGIKWDWKFNRLWVSDESNARLQVFDADGNYIDEWSCGLHSPSSIVMTGDLLAVGQMPSPACFTVFDTSGADNTTIGQCKELQSLTIGNPPLRIGHMLGASPLPGDTSLYQPFPFNGICIEKYVQKEATQL